MSDAMSDARGVIIKIEGMKQALDRLQSLPMKMENKIIRKGLRAGAKIVRQAATQEAPSVSGATRKAIKVRAGKRRKGYLAVLVSVGQRWFTGATFYAAFVEYGHKLIRKRAGVKTVIGIVKANPFMKRAADRTRQETTQAVADTITKETSKATARGIIA